MMEIDPTAAHKMNLLRALVVPAGEEALIPPPVPCNVSFIFPVRSENGFRLEFTNGTVIEAEIANVKVSNPRIE